MNNKIFLPKMMMLEKAKEVSVGNFSNLQICQPDNHRKEVYSVL